MSKLDRKDDKELDSFTNSSLSEEEFISGCTPPKPEKPGRSTLEMFPIYRAYREGLLKIVDRDDKKEKQST